MNAMMSALCLALALCLAVAVQAHPHGGVKELHAQLADPGVFLQQHAGSDFHPVKLTPYRAGDALTYYSYHIHAYFLSSNANQTANAKTLRQSFIDKFAVGQCGGDCAVWCPSICHWDMNMGPAGPHPVASFGFYVPLDRMLDALAFISMNHNDLSILVHPNSGYPILDHATNALWIKQILPLDTSQLEPYVPPPPHVAGW